MNKYQKVMIINKKFSNNLQFKIINMFKLIIMKLKLMIRKKFIIWIKYIQKFITNQIMMKIKPIIFQNVLFLINIY